MRIINQCFHKSLQRELRILVFSLLPILLVGCAGTPTLVKDELKGVLIGYSEQPSVENAVATVELGMAQWAEISSADKAADVSKVFIGFKGETKTEFGAVKLLPGKYKITYGRLFAISFLVDPDMRHESRVTEKIILAPGRIYRLNWTRTHGRGYQRYYWIEDTTTGEVVVPSCQSDRGEGPAEIRAMAQEGNDRAQYWLAYWYDGSNCLGEDRTTYAWDYESAVKWYRLSAEQGNSLAQRSLGRSYWFGKGVDVDLPKALEWFRKAAEQGDRDAQYYVGNFHHEGLGVEIDLEIAREWYKRAAAKGHTQAARKLENILE